MIEFLIFYKFHLTGRLWKHLSLKLKCWYKYLKKNSNHSIHWTGSLILYTWKKIFKQTLSAQPWHSLSNKSMLKDTFQKQTTRHLLTCRKSKRNTEAKNKQNGNQREMEHSSENQMCFKKATSIIKHQQVKFYFLFAAIVLELQWSNENDWFSLS